MEHGQIAHHGTRTEVVLSQPLDPFNASAPRRFVASCKSGSKVFTTGLNWHQSDEHLN
ncbi:hypothetical protein XACS582_14740002 [Xanthomonas citri pv. citri]|uniref:Uncharacterized protein n=1 Tax=Xanthomonas citri pv. citri TaxID=611301 RepID=A0A0U5F8I6_XANCI|nr:hypothetical protein XAC3824_1360002 [Xanthomonas citri pv. citri]CEE17845.1 hypothetical protein XAC1083_1150002 [Xanthomonas citri pv. citri]CEE24542.1 hypothetical protein XAC3810_1270010 [Xanthomonas citri pv. citri]CEE24628.1 hypothetical protein XAC902_1490002 [Xanthomonas citri pv. citri]CEE26653.1 hypothetical protein XAC908_1390002 [Xanthomonas citri pv. citri]